MSLLRGQFAEKQCVLAVVQWNNLLSCKVILCLVVKLERMMFRCV